MGEDDRRAVDIADLEEYFISCLVRSRDWQAVSQARINPEYFDDDQHRRVFEFIQRHYATHNEVPLPHMIKRNWPSYRLVKVEHGIGYYIEEIRNKYLFGQLQLTLADMQEQLDENRDPRAALKIMQAVVGDLTTIDNVMVDVDLAATWEERLEEYEEFRENQGKLRGITTGFPSLDKATLGWLGGQFVVIIGLPKSGKSTLLLAIALAAHALGLKVLFIGFEMSNQETGARYDSQVAKVDHLRLLSGQIGAKDIQRLEREGERRSKEPYAPFIGSTDIASTTTVSGVRAKIAQHQPDLVLVDGLYLMDDEFGEAKGSSAALTNISRGLRKIAQLDDVPIIGTHQALHSKVSRAYGLTMASAGYTSAFAQDAHLMIAVEAVEDEPSLQRVKTVANRIGPNVEFEVQWDWSTGTFEETESDDIEVEDA